MPKKSPPSGKKTKTYTTPSLDFGAIPSSLYNNATTPDLSSCSDSTDCDLPLILHLQIPHLDPATSANDMNSAEDPPIQHREDTSLSAAFSYTPKLDIPHPYEVHMSDSMPCTVEHQHSRTTENNNDNDNNNNNNNNNKSLQPNSIYRDIEGVPQHSHSGEGTTQTGCCWWCCHAYQSTAVSLPLTKHISGKFLTIGQFCSIECAAAYNFESGTRYGDIWKQYALLHEMYVSYTKTPTPRIKFAPPRECLQMFGGPYTITQYREILATPHKQIQMTVKPINPLFTVTEDIPSCLNYPTKQQSVPLDTTRVQKATTELRLKRLKKNTKENTLENFMQLKIGV
jgi:hypothetical protein